MAARRGKIFAFIAIAAFGEGLGWQGFLLPLLAEEFGERGAVLLNGILLGAALLARLGREK